MEEYKTDKEILNSNDENAIVNKLSEYITEADEYFEDLRGKFEFYKEVYDAVVDEDYPLICNYFLPITTRMVDIVSAKTTNILYGEEPYWNNMRAAETHEDKEEAKITSKILKENLYEDNLFYSVKEATIKDSIIYGLGIEKDCWDYKERKVNQREEIVNVDETEEGNLETETEIKADIEIVKDSNLIKNVGVWDIRLDPTATYPNAENSRFIIERNFYTENELLESFVNAKKYLDDLKSDSFGGDTEYETDDDIENSRQRREQDLFLVYEIYTSCGHRFFMTEVSQNANLLQPVNTTEKTKYLNPYNHGDYPYLIFYHRYNTDNIYGEGMVKELAPLNLATNDFFNLTIESFLMQLKTPTGINPRYVEPSDFQNAMNTPNGMFTLLDDIPNIHNAVMRPNLGYSSGEMFRAYQAMDTQMQLQSSITNFQQGGVSTGQYNQTLGGIQAILNES
jgi:hypothetical protein